METFDARKAAEQLGIKYLTGEACALSRRILCDLTAAGRDLWCDYFGMNPTGLADNYNSGGAASVMIDREIMDLLIRNMWVYNEQLRGRWVGLVKFQSGDTMLVSVEASTEWEVETLVQTEMASTEWIFDRVWAPLKRRDGVNVGTRNIHQMSGRVA